MKRTVYSYALALVAIAFGLQWLEYRFVMRSLPATGLVSSVAMVFAALGVWVGLRLARREQGGPFVVNQAAVTRLGISPREYAVLEQLAAGLANKEIARELGISPNTVKTHVARLYNKLAVSNRTEAVGKARELRLIA